jgi:hypothetical protein
VILNPENPADQHGGVTPAIPPESQCFRFFHDGASMGMATAFIE